MSAFVKVATNILGAGWVVNGHRYVIAFQNAWMISTLSLSALWQFGRSPASVGQGSAAATRVAAALQGAVLAEHDELERAGAAPRAGPPDAVPAAL